MNDEEARQGLRVINQIRLDDIEATGATALQRALRRLAAAFDLACTDARTFEAFLKIATIRVASENARVAESRSAR
jgi:hypothetical protein